MTTFASGTPTDARRVVLRVLAELAVSKEFHAASARRAQHTLASVIAQLFPVLLAELQSLALLASSLATLHATHGDYLLILLQLIHFVLATATQPRVTVETLQDKGLLRALLVFVPSMPSADHELPPWLSALLRLVGECALWNGAFAAYVHRVPRIVALLPVLVDTRPTELFLLWLAAQQHNVALPISARTTTTVSLADMDLWSFFESDHIFPTHCASYLVAMHQLSDTLFVLDCVFKALPVLRPTVRDTLCDRLHRIHTTRFTSAFQYPTYFVPTMRTSRPDVVDQDPTKNEPEPPPPPASDVPTTHDDGEERGRAEALQFLALRNRVRHSIKTILLSNPTEFGSTGSSSKLD